MDETTGVTPAEIGRFLTTVREKAGIKQAELARKVTWSPAVLSRVEAGERTLGIDELEAILSAIGTPEALHLSEMLTRSWTVLPRPSLEHPDQDMLWEAEQVASELAELRSRPEVRHAFERRLTEYISEIELLSGLLLKRDHQVAFIGSIGIGKSTAICRMTGLEIPSQDGGMPAPVLEAGAGGVTICEVHLRTGPDYGLMIEPRSNDEIREDVNDFAEHILRGEVAVEDELGENDSQGISKEIERAVRNMASLKIRREKGADGKTIRRDEAKELARKFNSSRELMVEVLARMELHRRDRRDVWYDTNVGKPPLVWLKDTFEQVNNGRHPEFSLPKRIEVVVPRSLLGTPNLTIRLIDTKGIDRTAARADIENHLDEPHTLAVLCSGFNNAPAAEPQLLLNRAKEAGIRYLDLNAALLILPRPNEALAVKDESGFKVENFEEGYELKAEQVSMALEPLGLSQLSVDFFNAYQDEPERLRSFLIARIDRIRESFREQIRQSIDNARMLLRNHEKEQVQEVLRDAGRMLKSWITEQSAIDSPSVHIQDSLIDAMTKAYASTVRATVRREGEWYNLSYSHHLGHGARHIAAASLGKNVENFSSFCKVLLGNPDYEEAVELIQQAERVLLVTYEELLRKMKLMGETNFRNELKVDQAFWQACEAEWGRGPGYRNRVTAINSDWFNAVPRQQFEEKLRSLIEREWAQVLERVMALFE